MSPPDENTEASPGFFGRLQARLNRGGASLARDLRLVLRGRKIDAAVLEDLESRLLSADVGVEATQDILSELNRRVARHELDDVEALLAAVRDRLTELLAPCEQPLHIERDTRPFVVLIIGVNGSGKTTSIGKLAQQLRAQNLSVLLAAGDTFRAAAVEQLHVWAERTGATFSAQQTGADPGAVIFDALKSAQARHIDVVLADTAGRLHSQSHLMDELKKVKRVIQRLDPHAPQEVLLVLDANQGQNALAQAQQFHAALGVTGLVLTKLDGSARGGIVVAIARALKLPIRFLGVGEKAEDFGPFSARAFASALIDGAAPVIRFERVSKRYPNGREALSDLNFEIADGEMVFVTGRSGAGKSTVLKLIALLERPTRGLIAVNGENTARLPLRRVPQFRRQIGVVFQDHRLLMDRPVFDNVALPLIVADISFRDMDKRVRAALDQVGLLGKERVAPLELSVGEQQRVGIARAIVSKPPLLVADEPTGNLDATLAGEVMGLFRRFNEVGVTVVVATHDHHLVQALGQRQIMLVDGRAGDGESPSGGPMDGAEAMIISR